MAELPYQYSTDKLTKDQMGSAIDYMMQKAKDQRWAFERRWYDNNFFDDGYHFRYLSRTENKIVDLSQASTIWSPMRSLPKASRQIRGIANLLVSRAFVPVVYPEKVSTSQFPSQQDPQTGQKIPNREYQQALDEAKRVAKGSGHWIEEEFKKQNLLEKLALMIILTAKHGVSYLQVWPDAVEDNLKTAVYDAFDIYLMGSLQEIEDSPFIIKTRPRLISEIKADERFDPEQLEKINPDNRHASSDIKEAYSKARYGGLGNADQAATVIEKEAFVKEFLNKNNMPRIRMQKNGGEILKRRKEGDPVYRQTFGAGNITLRDEYLNLPGYPFVDLRFEPGPIYQVPLIERFIPINKSLDLVVSRVERFTHTMVTGSWSIKSGESAEPNNTAGGQIFNYATTPPIQNPIANIPAFVPFFIGLLESFIDEQGVSTSALNRIPKGVKAHAAIESLRETEFQNLSIPMERLKGVVKRIAEKKLDYADDYFVRPQTVYYLEKGEPQYFDIIGNTALQKRQELRIDEQPLDAIPIKRDYRVEIEVQSGLAYTREGQKAAAKELGDYMVSIAQLGLLSPEVVKVYIGKLLETYGFGATQEIMEAMEQGAGNQLTDQQVDAVKLAVLEVMKDLISNGVLPDQEQRIEEGKVAMAEVIKDTGLIDEVADREDPKVQMEMAKTTQAIQHKEDEHSQKMGQSERNQSIKEEQAERMMRLKEKMAKSMATKGGQNATSRN